ncbi:hypothetical protein [Microbacterium sp. NPDC058389]|uniref:hypothetical protein n=1 Tax=Microbacterium sp. NPDC058389 TaxID=3346475 RepID=UPI00365C5FE9
MKKFRASIASIATVGVLAGVLLTAAPASAAADLYYRATTLAKCQAGQADLRAQGAKILVSCNYQHNGFWRVTYTW